MVTMRVGPCAISFPGLSGRWVSGIRPGLAGRMLPFLLQAALGQAWALTSSNKPKAAPNARQHLDGIGASWDGGNRPRRAPP